MKLVAKTLYGLENALAQELVSLGATGIKPLNRAVLFNGDKKLLYKANYCLRSAMSVLLPVAEFRIRSKEDLYSEGERIEWEKYINPESTFSITPVVNSPYFPHTGYAGLLLKDSIADRFRNKTGKRPSVDTSNPGILINLHISNDKVTVSLDSSAVPLFKRGYRKEQSAAPLNEVLAAGMLLISGWNGEVPLIDPMCGSGTISIEAALIARKIPPGKFRSSFGFQQWSDYDESLFESIKEESDGLISDKAADIYCSDISEEAVRLASANVIRAGLGSDISFQVVDFKDLKINENNGVIFMNPPYGLRLNQNDTDDLYGMIGSTLKHKFQGFTAWLISSNRESVKQIGLKHSQKFTLFNGALECNLLKYDLYQGSRKIKPA